MWYKCLNENCGFVFTRSGECDQCPDCGKELLREATPEEIEVQTCYMSNDKNQPLLYFT